MEKFLNQVIKWAIYLSVFLMPIFFLPFSYEPLEFNKQYLLVFTVSVGVLAWLIKMVLVQKEIKFRWFAINIPILSFLLIAILSTIFSIEKLTSAFGFYGRFSGSLIEIIAMVFFYFLLINNVKVVAPAVGEEDKGEAKIPGIINGFLWSFLTVLVVSLLSTFGVWQLIESAIGKMNVHLPLFFTRIFNTVSGSPDGLAIFLAVALVFISILFFQKEKSTQKTVLLSTLFALATIILIMIDSTSAWIVLGLSMLLFLIFAFWSRIFIDRINLLFIPIILFALSVVFFFVQVSSGPSLQILGFNILAQPREILLDQPSTWQTTLNTIKSYPVLGSGPSTFAQDFSKFKPQDFNKNYFWQIRFDRGGNYVAEMIMTLGVLGFLAWLGIIGITLLMGYVLILKIKKENISFNYGIPLLFTFIALFVAQLVYYQNVILSFLFWLILGLLMISWLKDPAEKRFSFGQFPEVRLLFTIFIIIIALGIFGVWFFAGRFYAADIEYVKGVQSGKTSLLEKAVALNGLRAGYDVVLSRAYFADAVKALSSSNNQQGVQTAQNEFAKSVAQARKVIALSPNWVVGPENLGMIYRDLRSYIQSVSSFAEEFFTKAENLEPYNPVLVVEVGKLYRDDQNYSQAQKEFEKALILKSDYPDSKIQLAITLALEGYTDNAIEKLQEVTKENPTNIDGYLQLGIMYYNNNQIDDAISQLQQALTLSPNNANALYVLGLSYNKKGDKDSALQALNKVLELNPGNQDVISKISEIQNPPVQTPSKTTTKTTK